VPVPRNFFLEEAFSGKNPGFSPRERFLTEDEDDQRTVRASHGGLSHGPRSSPPRWEAKAPSACGARQPVRPRASWDGSPLPPVPHLDTMPWFNSGSAIRGPKMDILLGPQLEMVGPFLVQPSILATQVWSDLRPRETGIAAQ
jgi:hypothetical protein